MSIVTHLGIDIWKEFKSSAWKGGSLVESFVYDGMYDKIMSGIEYLCLVLYGKCY